MKTKITLLAMTAIVAGGIIAGLYFTNRPATNKTAPLAAAAPAVQVPAKKNEVLAAPETTVVRVRSVPPTTPSEPKIQSKAAEKSTAQTEPPLKINGYELQDPLARIALNFVGTDPDAEAYWVGAINDSAVPAEERKDLIEDLNEDGLADPRHPAAQDMPLILRRIQLLEQLAPNALDDVNRDAFKEAYKDLVGLLNGQPPQ